MPTTRMQIGPKDLGRRLTLEEFREADEKPGYRYELARGVLEVTQVPNDPHWQVVDNLQLRISAYRQDHPEIIQRAGGGGECRVWIREMISGRNPDYAIVLKGTPKDESGRQPPSLVAEVVSEGSAERDYHTKREEYLVFGIQEYWIVDPDQRQVTVLVRQETGANSSWAEHVFQGDDPIESTLLPGFEGTVGALWVDVEPEESAT
jgi:Uma2 family endonuclease